MRLSSKYPTLKMAKDFLYIWYQIPMKGSLEKKYTFLIKINTI